MIKKIYKRLHSTNSKAQELIENLDKEAGNDLMWVQAQEQYEGRGLGSNIWFSEPGKNITGSLVIYPDFLKAEQQFEISVAASLAVKDLLDMYVEEVNIKWPNDILVEGKKIAGLLVEHAIVGTGIKHSIIGIGLNVNQKLFPDIIPNPVSIKQILAINIDVDELADLLLIYLGSRITQLENGHFGMMKEEYLKSLFRYKEFAPFKTDNKWLRARIIDIDPFGQLVLETESGKIRKFGFKEVEFID